MACGPLTSLALGPRLVAGIGALNEASRRKAEAPGDRNRGLENLKTCIFSNDLIKRRMRVMAMAGSDLTVATSSAKQTSATQQGSALQSLTVPEVRRQQ